MLSPQFQTAKLVTPSWSSRNQLIAIRLILTLVVVVPVTCARATQEWTEHRLLVENVRLFDPASGVFTAPTDLLIHGDRIEMIGNLGMQDRGVTRLNAAGRFALPGLWDSHVHLSFLTMGGDSAVQERLGAFVRNGITYVRDVGGPIETIAAMSRRIRSGTIVGPRIFYSGPLLTKAPLDRDFVELNQVLPGTAIAVSIPVDIDTMLDRLVEHGATMAKAIGRWDTELLRHFVSAAKARSLPVVFDPGPPILNDIPIDTALMAGVSSIEHVQAPWLRVLRDSLAREVDAFRTSGGSGAAANDLIFRTMALGEESVSRERLVQLADRWARSGSYFTPTLTVAVASELQSINSAAYEGRLSVGRLFVRELSSRGVRLLVGQDGDSPDGALAEMELLAKAGLDPREILRGATIYPAQFLGVSDSVGVLQPGTRADILILDANPLERIENIRSVWNVVHDGRLVRQ
jgi:imidazolonepropionase-like amidohydrolase